MRRLVIAALIWAAAASPLWADCKLGKLADLTAIIEGWRLYVPGKINDHDVIFMVDTGADTFLFRGGAAAAGVEVASTVGESYGATGREAAEGRGIVDSLQIGLWSGHNVALRAAGAGEADSVGGKPVVGVLGEDILRHFDVEIDIKNNLFALYQSQGCDTSNLAYWTDNYNVVDLIRYNGFDPRIMMNGTLNDRMISVLLDTGAPFTAISYEVARSLGVTPDSPGVVPVGEVRGIHDQGTDSWIGNFTSFALDQEKISPAKLRFFKFAEASPSGESRLSHRAMAYDMLLGFDFIRAHHLLISHSQHKLYFSYSGGQPFYVPKPQKAAETAK